MPQGEIKLEYESDLHSNEHNLRNSEKKAWKKKNSGLYRIWTNDLYDTGAVLYQLSLQANWELVTVLVPNKKKSYQTKTHKNVTYQGLSDHGQNEAVLNQVNQVCEPQ